MGSFRCGAWLAGEAVGGGAFGGVYREIRLGDWDWDWEIVGVRVQTAYQSALKL